MKKRKILIILILMLLIYPIKTNASTECTQKCSGHSSECLSCCEKFFDDKDLGPNTFVVDNFENKYNSNCQSYIDGSKEAIKKVEETAECRALLGNPDNEKSVAWMLQQILNYAKYGGIFLVLLLSSIDFAKAIVVNDDESMKKAQKRLIFRLIAAVFLFFVPTLVMVMLNIFGLTDDPTCGIE